MPRKFLFLILISSLCLMPRAPAMAQDYPSRPVRVIVPFGAGGPTDVFTRAISEELRKSLGRTTDEADAIKQARTHRS